jgi:hypothetical protein
MTARTAVLAYLAGTLHDLAVAARVPETDAADGYGFAITQALTTAGLAADAGSLPGSATAHVYLLADYYGLLRLQRAFATRVDVSSRLPGDEVVVTDRRSQYFAQVTQLLTAARKAAEDAGLIAAVPIPVLRTARPRRGDLARRGSEYRREGWE